MAAQTRVRHYVDGDPSDILKATDNLGMESVDRTPCQRTYENSIASYREIHIVCDSGDIGDGLPSRVRPGNTVNGIYNQVRRVCAGGYKKMTPSIQTQVNEGGDLWAMAKEPVEPLGELEKEESPGFLCPRWKCVSPGPAVEPSVSGNVRGAEVQALSADLA